MASSIGSRKAILAFLRHHQAHPGSIAGLRRVRLVPVGKSESLISVYDGIAQNMDTYAGRWQTVCETHSNICSHRTLDLAVSWIPEPTMWCEGCQDEADQ